MEARNEEKAPPPRPSLATTDAFQYTPQGMQAKLDERQFRRIDSMQPREARIRMLNALYQEMLDTSVKGDPAMQRKDDASDGCAPLRAAARTNETVHHVARSSAAHRARAHGASDCGDGPVSDASMSES